MMNWIRVEDKLPEVGEEVIVLYERKSYFSDKIYQVTTFAEYYDGKTSEEDFMGNFDDYWEDLEYDEEQDTYLVPKGWYEFLTSVNGEYWCKLDDEEEKVIAWLPKSVLPEFKK